MIETLEKLLLLQERDQRLQTFLREIEGVPAEKAAFERELQAAQQTLATAKERASQIEIERKRLEVEAEGKRSQIAKYRTQQFETRKNEEYAALKNEIERAEKDIIDIEDRVLELMEEAENLKPAIADAEQKFSAEKTRVTALLKSTDDKVGILQGRSEALNVERTALASEVQTLDENLFELYENLFRTKDGRAVVALEGEHCSGCHTTVTRSTVLEVEARKSIVSCEQCGRILYALEE